MSFFTFPHIRNSLGPPKETLEKSSGPRIGALYFTPCNKSLDPWRETWPGSRDQNFLAWGNVKDHLLGSGRLGTKKKATARISCFNIYYAMMPATVEPTTAETLLRAWVPAGSKSMGKDKSMDASNSRADNRRNTCNSMKAGNRNRARSWTPVTIRPTTINNEAVVHW